MVLSSALVSLAAIWVAAHLSPGPDLILSVRMGLSQTRRVGLFAVAGICLGIAFWSVATFFGISLLFAEAPWTFRALKVAGGAYLVYLGVRLVVASLRAADGDDFGGPSMPSDSSLRLGFLTNLTNPNAPIFIASLFSATLPAAPSMTFGLVAIGVMIGISFCIYGGVVCALTTPTLAHVFFRARRWLDRMAGLIFLGLGARFLMVG